VQRVSTFHVDYWLNLKEFADFIGGPRLFIRACPIRRLVVGIEPGHFDREVFELVFDRVDVRLGFVGIPIVA